MYALREGKPFPVSSLWELILSDQDLTHMASFNLNDFLRGPISKNNHTVGMTYEFWEDTNIKAVTVLLIIWGVVALDHLGQWVTDKLRILDFALSSKILCWGFPN